MFADSKKSISAKDPPCTEGILSFIFLPSCANFTSSSNFVQPDLTTLSCFFK